MKKVVRMITLMGINVLLLTLPASAQEDLWSKHYKAGTEEMRKGWMDSAIRHFNEALKEAEKSGTPDERLSNTLKSLASIYQIMPTKVLDAEKMFMRALEIDLNTHAADDVILDDLMGLGIFYTNWTNNIEAGIPWYEKAVQLAAKMKGSESTFVGMLLNFIADTYIRLKKYDKAEPYYLRSIAIYEKAPKPKYRSELESTFKGYITILKKMDRMDDAKEMEKRIKQLKAGK